MHVIEPISEAAKKEISERSEALHKARFQEIAKEERAAAEAGRLAAEAKRLAVENAQKKADAEQQEIENAKRRIWTSSNGRYTIDAKFISFAVGSVTLEKSDGKRIFVRLDRLSKKDQDFIRYRKWLRNTAKD